MRVTASSILYAFHRQQKIENIEEDKLNTSVSKKSVTKNDSASGYLRVGQAEEGLLLFLVVRLA